jgi:hypothetical protein
VRASALSDDIEIVLTDAWCHEDLMVNTKVAAVTDLDGPANEYQVDANPMTLEIVMLSKCGNEPEVQSAVWFREALAGFRAESNSAQEH